MTKSNILLSAAALAFATAGAASPALAQARAVAVISTDGAIQGSQAFQNAQQALRTTYAAQYQQLQTRQQALQGELTALQTAYNTAVQAQGATAESVRPQATALAQKQQAAQAELQRLQEPLALAEAYVREQIGVHLDAAAKAAMQQKGVDLALRPEAIVVAAAGSEANLTDEVVAELNRRVQNVAVQPPTGWQPGQTMQAARAQQSQQQ